jgi:hypothetical protein
VAWFAEADHEGAGQQHLDRPDVILVLVDQLGVQQALVEVGAARDKTAGRPASCSQAVMTSTS